jgi:hypothetical protein
MRSHNRAMRFAYCAPRRSRAVLGQFERIEVVADESGSHPIAIESAHTPQQKPVRATSGHSALQRQVDCAAAREQSVIRATRWRLEL